MRAVEWRDIKYMAAGASNFQPGPVRPCPKTRNGPEIWLGWLGLKLLLGPGRVIEVSKELMFWFRLCGQEFQFFVFKEFVDPDFLRLRI